MKFLIFLEGALAILFWALIMFGFDLAYIAVLTILSALLHECGHLLFASLFTRGGGAHIKGDISGFRISVKSLSYKEELAVVIGGPLANALIFLLLFWVSSEYLNIFALINLLTAISNLIPIEGYDGYRALSCLLFMKFRDTGGVLRLLPAISLFFSALLSFLALYLILKLGEGYWIFAIFFSATLIKLMKSQKDTICEKNGDF